MSGTSGDVFFWNDYQGEASLRACSLAAQGLWMRLMCIAALSTKKGYVLVNGQKPSIGILARIVGCGPAELQKLGQELEANGVFSRDRDGVIYCRRMVKREQRLKNSAKGGRRGGASTFLKKKGIFATQETTQDGTVDSIHNPSSQSQSHSKTSKKQAAAQLRSQGGISIPDWLPRQPWLDFVEMRRSKRNPFTVRAAEGIVADLEKLLAAGDDPEAVLLESVKNGWSGVFPLKSQTATTATGAPVRPGAQVIRLFDEPADEEKKA